MDRDTGRARGFAFVTMKSEHTILSCPAGVAEVARLGERLGRGDERVAHLTDTRGDEPGWEDRERKRILRLVAEVASRTALRAKVDASAIRTRIIQDYSISAVARVSLRCGAVEPGARDGR